jgi:hypothetical protein
MASLIGSGEDYICSVCEKLCPSYMEVIDVVQPFLRSVELPFDSALLIFQYLGIRDWHSGAPWYCATCDARVCTRDDCQVVCCQCGTLHCSNCSDIADTHVCDECMHKQQ